MHAHRPHESDGRASGQTNQNKPYLETRRRRIGLVPESQGINSRRRRKAGDHLTDASSKLFAHVISSIGAPAIVIATDGFDAGGLPGLEIDQN